MSKVIYSITVLLFLFPITTFAISTGSQQTSIEISYINVTLNGQNINSGVVDVEPGQQLQVHVIFNYYGGIITNYPATQLRLDDGKFNGEIQALPNHFEKISDTQAAENVIISISSTAKTGDIIPVKFIITGPDVDSEEGETITFVIKEFSTNTSSSTDDTTSNNNQTSSAESSTATTQTSSNSTGSTCSDTTTADASNGSQSDSIYSSSIVSKSTELISSSSSNDKLLINSSNFDSNYSNKKTDDSKESFIENSEVVYLTNSEKKRIFKFLPRTGMEPSALKWMILGITNIFVAIYLLRKK